jgi:hypothetical protein
MPAVTIWGLWVPATFWDDHADRCPSDDGSAGLMREDKRRGNRVRVTGSARQLECLRSDAAFYCGVDGPDECPANIKRSARRTLEVINQARAENPALYAEMARCRRG